MNDSALIEQVRELMAETFGIDEDEITEDASQETLSKWTSMQHMTLLASLEEQFGLTLSMDEMTSMTSLPKIVAVLKKHGAN